MKLRAYTNPSLMGNYQLEYYKSSVASGHIPDFSYSQCIFLILRQTNVEERLLRHINIKDRTHGQWLGVITLKRGHKCFYCGIRGEWWRGRRAGGARRGAWRVRARRPSPSAYNKRARRTRRLASATTAAPVHDARSVHSATSHLAPHTVTAAARRYRPRRLVTQYYYTNNNSQQADHSYQHKVSHSWVLSLHLPTSAYSIPGIKRL